MLCMQEHICSAAPAVVEDYRDLTALSKQLEVCLACLEGPVFSAALPVQCPAQSPLVQAAIQPRRILMHITISVQVTKFGRTLCTDCAAVVFSQLCNESMKKMPAMRRGTICTCLCWSEGMTVACSAEGAGRCRICR